VIDHHCHSIARTPPADVAAFRAPFTESRDPSFIRDHMLQWPSYCRAVRELCAFYGVVGEEALVRHIRTLPLADRARRLFADAGFEMLLVDTGYRPEDLLTVEELGDIVPARPVLRIERVAEDLLPESSTPDALIGGVLEHIRKAVRAGAVAVKTVLAYRTGLRIAAHPPSEVREAFSQVKTSTKAGRRVRLTSKPLLDTLVWEVCQAAGELRIPVQIHTGFGDADLLLPDSNPAWLKPLFEDPACRNATFVLLHCHPYVRDAAWLASVYGNVYMDLSLTIPMTGHGAAEAIAAALQLAPWSKVLLATDAHTLPERFWAAARLMRDALRKALAEMRSHGFLTDSDLEAATAALLAENARGVYRLRSLSGSDEG